MNGIDNWYKEDCVDRNITSSRACYLLGYTRAIRHAHWKFKPVKNEDGQIYVHCYTCSNCKAIDEHQGAAPYCWNCGAKMEGRLDG